MTDWIQPTRPNDEGYKLPNGCFIRPGGRVRVPKEHLDLIPLEDWEKFGLDIVEGEQSFASEVISRSPYSGGVQTEGET